MKRILLTLGWLPLAAAPLAAQAVPDGSQASKVQPAYRRTPTFRVDPFRHAMIPHWGLVFSAGATGENNVLNLADIGALRFLGDSANNPGGLTTGDLVDVINLVPDGKGIKGSGVGEGGVYLGGPFGSHFSLGFSGQVRGYGSGQVNDSLVAFLREGNIARQDFSFGSSGGEAIATAEVGGHAVLRFGPLGSEDGVNVSLGIGGRYIKPIAYFAAQGSGTIRVTADSVRANNVTLSTARTPFDASVSGLFNKIDSTFRGSKSKIATDLLLRLTWPTSGFALEAMVANVGRTVLTVHRVETERQTLTLQTANIMDVKDALDTLPKVKDTTDVLVKLPRIVRFTASSWANRILQIDVSATMPVHGDFESPLAVDVGTTWRFVRTIPLRAGVVLGGDQGIGFTGGLAIEGRNMFLQIMGQSLGGLFRNATGAGARFELGTFF